MYSLLRSMLMVTLVATISSSTISEKESSEMDDITEDLQQQIDELRKQIQDILKQSENTTDQEILTKLKNNMDSLQVQVQQLYKHIDKLSSDLKQQFRQKLDDLMRETFEAHKKLEARIQNLEDLVQKIAINQCAGNLRDGMVETAIATFRNIKNPTLHIEQIIQEAYQNVNDCTKLMEFLKKIDSQAELSIKAKNEIRARGYDSLYNFLNKVQFSPEGSNCAYPLAWNVNEIQNRLQNEEIITKDYTTRVLNKIPKSISKFTVDKLVKLFVPSEDPAKEIPTCYFNERSAHYIIYDVYWNTTQTKDGTWYMLFNQDERPLSNFMVMSIASVLSLSKMKYTNMVDNDTALWKPVAVSNSQFYLQNKKGAGSQLGSYCMRNNKFTEGNFECYMLSLADFKYRFLFTVQ